MMNTERKFVLTFQFQIFNVVQRPTLIITVRVNLQKENQEARAYQIRY